MSLLLDNPLTFRTLYESSILSVRDYSCRAGRGDSGADEHSLVNSIVLIRRGAFCKHVGRQSVTADANQAVFFTRESTYRVSHPADCGDRGTVFVLSPRVLNDMIRELDPSIDDHPERPFPFVIGPCDSAVFLRHGELVRRLEVTETQTIEPLWADVTVLQLMADVLEDVFLHDGLPIKSHRKDTEADHADRAEAAKAYLASRLCERIVLNDVASAVHMSPYHFARTFQQYTGVPIHRYLTRLRLRTSLERLIDGTTDLTALALDVGFSSHSHFTDTFRREFGRTPSDVRRVSNSRTLREMSKNLEA